MLGTKKHSKQKTKIRYLKYFEQYWRNSVKNKLEKLNESCQKKKKSPLVCLNEAVTKQLDLHQLSHPEEKPKQNSNH